MAFVALMFACAALGFYLDLMGKNKKLTARVEVLEKKINKE